MKQDEPRGITNKKKRILNESVSQTPFAKHIRT